MNMKKKTKQSIGLYSIFLGVSVLIMWIFILLTEPLQEGKKEMVFHLFSELIMAVLCITSGFILLKKGKKYLNIAAHAMIIYSVINAAGYYIQRGDQLMTTFFVILFLISILILTILMYEFHSGRT